MTKKEQLRDEAKKILLRDYINKKTKLLIVIKSVSQSGLSRRMKVLTSPEQCNITPLIADLCDLSMNDNGLIFKKFHAH